MKYKATSRYVHGWVDEDYLLGLSWRRTPRRKFLNLWRRLTGWKILHRRSEGQPVRPGLNWSWYRGRYGSAHLRIGRRIWHLRYCWERGWEGQPSYPRRLFLSYRRI